MLVIHDEFNDDVLFRLDLKSGGGEGGGGGGGGGRVGEVRHEEQAES